VRIAVLNWCDRVVGGVEVYLDALLPELGRRGHSLARCVGERIGGERDEIRCPPGTATWILSDLGAGAALDALRDWGPDVVFKNVFDNPEFERDVSTIAPLVFFAHAYYGTCISGLKSVRVPTARPCDRHFGTMCLVNYFPRRCGGLNPVTMLREYRRQTRQFELLPEYDAVVTHSGHMRDEYIRHGVPPERAHVIPFFARSGMPRSLAYSGGLGETGVARLLFLGRMDFGKGGQFLLDALPLIARKIGRPVAGTFAGDGPERARWVQRAERIMRNCKSVSVDFVGWVGEEALDELFGATDLLVIPSVWPEPFGQVGLEAGLRGVPAVAFDVGGISTWLQDGVNGRLAHGDAPSALALAEAIVACLDDPEELSRLRRQSRRVAADFTLDGHVSELLSVFESVRRRHRVPQSMALHTPERDA
jgi:glycosyltransferase involved in cell wall biosynthesis